METVLGFAASGIFAGVSGLKDLDALLSIALKGLSLITAALTIWLLVLRIRNARRRPPAPDTEL